jgi:hypothetical protein
MLNKKERFEKLNQAGINTGKYFTVDLDNGTKIHLIIDENGNCKQVKNDPIAEQIIEDGYVRNSKLHRRFVMAQMFHMLNYKSYDGQYNGYNDCLRHMYSYQYTLEMMLEEVRVLGKLEARDKETFDERVHFFNKDVVIAVMEDYAEKLKKYINELPNRNCKGVPYKRIKHADIFVADLHKKIFSPIRSYIGAVKCARNYNEVYRVLTQFMKKDKFIKLPADTPKSKEWIDAYKGAGAYYTLKNLVMFHGCTITDTYGIRYGASSMTYLKDTLDKYKGEYYRMFALMKKVIADNGINTKTYISDICNK